jgi:hypothetical protein
MKLAVTIFILLLAMCVVLAIALIVPEAPGGLSAKHATYETMSRATDGLTRHGRVLWAGWAFGLLQIVLYAGCIAFSVRRTAAGDPLRWALLVGTLLHAGAFCGMMIAYQRYIHTDEPGVVIGFPTPTAWMLYGMWSAPLFFIVLYYAAFDRWVMTPADRIRFRELVETNRKQDTL